MCLLRPAELHSFSAMRIAALLSSQSWFSLLVTELSQANASKSPHKLCRLNDLAQGLPGGASKAFMKQLWSEIEGFSEKVEYKDVDGKTKVDDFRLSVDRRTTDLELPERFLIVCGRRGG
jgi:hypothetical protein